MEEATVRSRLRLAASRIASRLEVVGELLRYLWDQKLWWLVPMVVVLVLVGALLLFAQGSAIAPFVYTLF